MGTPRKRKRAKMRKHKLKKIRRMMKRSQAFYIIYLLCTASSAVSAVAEFPYHGCGLVQHLGLVGGQVEEDGTAPVSSAR